MFQIFALFLVLPLQLFAAPGAGRVALPSIFEYFEERGIYEDYNDDSWQNLKSLLLKLKNDQKYESKKDFIDYSLKQMESEEKETKKRHEVFVLVKRIIYSVLADDVVREGLLPLRDIGHILVQLNNSSPYLDLDQRLEKIGDDSDSEAHSLYRRDDNQNEITKNEIKEMTYEELSYLDVGAKHPWWRSYEERSNKQNYWKKLEARASGEIWKKYDLNSEISTEKYDLEKARRVLFFKEIKTTSTAPKINAQDAYGQKWKVKWGLEVQTAPMATRLYIKLGARYTDLVYANGEGVESFVLILEDPKKAGSCEFVNSFYLFVTCLKKSKYKFNISSYVFEHGLIDSKNADRVLKNLSQSGQEKFKKENLLGRTYISFRESSSELQSKSSANRGGPVAGDFLGAENDRVIRSLMLFHMWIWNTDAKDDNSNSVMAKGLYPGEEKEYVEYAHDLGASLGSPAQGGLLNSLKTNDQFAHYGRLKNKDRIIFKQFVLYHPKSWKKMTFSDALWMVRQIGQISNNDLAEVARSSLWPDFMQRAFVRKMALRRDHLLKIYNLPREVRVPETLPKDYFGADLSTSKSRILWAKHYNLKVSEIEYELKKQDLIDENGQGHYVDWVMKNGEIVGCKRSLIVNLLERRHYPTGLSRRITRYKDDKPLKTCEFKG